MDLNELYHRHQVAVARAATSGNETLSHHDRARDYAARIADYQWLAGVVRPTMVLGA